MTLPRLWLGGAWSPCRWGADSNLFSSDVANVFMSRRGYLHADANASELEAAARDRTRLAEALREVTAERDAALRR